MWGIWAILIFFLDLIVIVEVLQSCRETLNKVFWVVIILCLPIAGMIIYFCFADRHKHYYVIIEELPEYTVATAI
jgi:hypothetical protein